MLSDSIIRARLWLCYTAFGLCLLPSLLAAESHGAPAESLEVFLEGYTLEPELTETGTPVLDDAGQPVLQRISLDDSVITPGDRVLYAITLNNPTEDPAMNLQLGLQVTAELLLDPYSFEGPEGLVVEWADADNLTEFYPIFIEVEGETLMQADLDNLRALRLTIPELPAAKEFSVEYAVTLR